MPHAIIHLIRLLAWAAENIPDDPQLGWKFVAGGGLLAGLMFLPQRYTENQPTLYTIQIVSIVAGCVLCVFGLFVFFRRAVWRLQDRREKRTISLFGK